MKVSCHLVCQRCGSDLGERVYDIGTVLAKLVECSCGRCGAGWTWIGLVVRSNG